MQQYNIIPHVADIRLKVEAGSLERLFSISLEGMNRILYKEYEKHLNKHTIIKEISVKSYDATSLLIDFLSEVLTLSHIHKAIFHRIDQLEIVGNSLHAHILGAKVDKFAEDIKAVTYHEAKIATNTKGNLETTIVFDI